MKVVFPCYLGDRGDGDYEWDAWFMLEDYQLNNQNPGIEREDDGSIFGFDIIADISDEWKDGVEYPDRVDEYSEDVHSALWKAIKAVFPPHGQSVKITQETCEDYAKRFPQIYADAKKEVEA